jgi:hypothetical protein
MLWADGYTDMTACIDYFKAIDPEVRLINTIVNRKPDTSYILRDVDKWEAQPALLLRRARSSL